MCSLCQLPWCKYSHCGRFQGTKVGNGTWGWKEKPTIGSRPRASQVQPTGEMGKTLGATGSGNTRRAQGSGAEIKFSPVS